MFPGYKVFRGRMSPRHVLPFRPVGIILVIEMPCAVFEEHAVGVVHPAIERRVVERRAVLLPVGRVERVREFHFLPARIVLHFAKRGAPLRGHDVQQHAVSLVGREEKRHEIVHAVHSQANVEVFDRFAVHEYFHARLFCRLLHGDEEIFGGAGHPHHSVVDPEVHHFNATLGKSRRSHRERGEHKQCHEFAF